MQGSSFLPHDIGFFGWYAFRVESAERFQQELVRLCGKETSTATMDNIFRNASVGGKKGGGFRPSHKGLGKWEATKAGRGYFRHEELDICFQTTHLDW